MSLCKVSLFILVWRCPWRTSFRICLSFSAGMRTLIWKWYVELKYFSLDFQWFYLYSNLQLMWEMVMLSIYFISCYCVMCGHFSLYVSIQISEKHFRSAAAVSLLTCFPGCYRTCSRYTKSYPYELSNINRKVC